jgi:hypothetical protein
MWILPEQVYDTPVSFEAPVLLKLGDDPPFEYNPSKGGSGTRDRPGRRASTTFRRRTLILPPGRDLSGRDVPARDVVFDPLDVPSRDAWDFATDVPVMAGGAEQRADPSCEGPRCIAIRSKVAADGSCEMPRERRLTMPASRDAGSASCAFAFVAKRTMPGPRCSRRCPCSTAKRRSGTNVVAPRAAPVPRSFPTIRAGSTSRRRLETPRSWWGFTDVSRASRCRSSRRARSRRACRSGPTSADRARSLEVTRGAARASFSRNAAEWVSSSALS